MANLKKRTVKRSNTSLKDLSKVLEDHGRHSMLSMTNTVFNFNKLVFDLDIHANTPES